MNTLHICLKHAPDSFFLHSGSISEPRASRQANSHINFLPWVAPRGSTQTAYWHVNKCTEKICCTVLKSKELHSAKKITCQFQMVWDLDLWKLQQWAAFIEHCQDSQKSPWRLFSKIRHFPVSCLSHFWWNLSKLHLAFANFLKICPDFGNRPMSSKK